MKAAAATGPRPDSPQIDSSGVSTRRAPCGVRGTRRGDDLLGVAGDVAHSRVELCTADLRASGGPVELGNPDDYRCIQVPRPCASSIRSTDVTPGPARAAGPQHVATSTWTALQRGGMRDARARAGRPASPRCGKANGSSGAAPLYAEVPFLWRVRLRLGLGQSLRAARRGLLPEARVRGAVHARHRGAAAGPRCAGAGAGSGRCSTSRGIAEVSSLHVLFPSDEDAAALRASGMLRAHGACNSTGAMPVRQLRRLPGRVCPTTSARRSARSAAGSPEAGVRFAPSHGARGEGHGLGFLHRLLSQDLPEHRSTPYLNRSFFGMIAERMADQVLLVGRSGTAGPSPPRSTSSGRRRSTGATGAASNTSRACTSRPATTRRSSSASSAASRSSKAAPRASTSTRAASCPQATRSFHWLAHPAFNRAVDEFLGPRRRGHRRLPGRAQRAHALPQIEFISRRRRIPSSGATAARR